MCSFSLSKSASEKDCHAFELSEAPPGYRLTFPDAVIHSDLQGLRVTGLWLKYATRLQITFSSPYGAVSPSTRPTYSPGPAVPSHAKVNTRRGNW